MNINIDSISDVNSYGLDVNNREIYLHSYISSQEEESPGVDYRMTATFYKNLRLLDTVNQDPIIIHMHSVGGNWYDGMAIFDAITVCRSYITIIVYGQAESMSSVILQAADARVMMPNSYFMAHFGSSGYEGNYLDVQQAARFEKKGTELMLDIYSERMIKGKYIKDSYTAPTHDKVKNFLKRRLKDGDWYLEAEEAVYYGFADNVLNSRRYPSIDSLKT